MFTTQWVIILLAKPFTAVWIILVGRGVAGLALGITLGVVPSYIIDISSAMNQGLGSVSPWSSVDVQHWFVICVCARCIGQGVVALSGLPGLAAANVCSYVRYS